jgi:RNA polymerase sigma-70 factor (ECF subfamily)
MAGEATFLDLLTRVRKGEEEAAAELLRRYEPFVRRFASNKLTDEALRRQFDSMDICQSVLGAFFVRTALGHFDLNSPDDLIKLLATMVSNKIREYTRKAHAARRDARRIEATAVEDMCVADSDAACPSRIMSGRELLQACRDRLGEEDLYLADQRILGRTWVELAAEKGVNPDALRMKFSRALDQVAEELGLEDSDAR